MATLRPGKHGSMPSSEFEGILTRNSNFLTVRRAGAGDGYAGLHCGVTGKFILGIGGGTLPEYSFMSKPEYNCVCSPGAKCATGMHGTGLVRGWRNILFELITKGRIRVTKEIVRTLGDIECYQAVERLMMNAPMANPAPEWKHSGIVLA